MGAGTYSCATGSFLPATAAERCCPRGGACDDGRPPCPAVVGGSNPTYDTAWNTEAAAKAQPDVPLEIVYTDRAAAVAAAEAEEVPLLLYGWEPDLFTSKDRFARVRMTEYVYCVTRTGRAVPAASAHPTLLPPYRYDYCGAETNLLVQTPVVCDYPIIQTEKIGYHAFEKLTPDAWALASKLSLNFTEIQRLLELQAANDGDDWEAACAWLKETSGEGVWDEWVVRLTWDWGPGVTAAIALAVAVVWVWFLGPLAECWAASRVKVMEVAATSQLKAKAAVESVDRVSQSSVLGCCGSQLRSCHRPPPPPPPPPRPPHPPHLLHHPSAGRAGGAKGGDARRGEGGSAMLDVAKEEQEAAEVEAEEEAFNPDMAATSVTLGATILLCRENDTQVQVPLFRRGRDTELTEVEVTTEDGSAKLGEVSSAT